MIDVRELRVGSCISGRQINIFRVDEIGIEDGLYTLRMYIGQLGGHSWLDMIPWDAMPLPLSENILLKCGFKNHKQSFSLEINELSSLVYSFETMFDSFHCYAYLSKIINHPKGGGHMDTAKYELNIIHLHQLQNLYFDLTGKELDVSRVLKEYSNR
ncbi:MAG TPA: hypothetical protein DDW85_02385 [Porphyromonadaceae bacterium]|nr:hypothetical protein [Porphyromonadaceae bacterium]